MALSVHRKIVAVEHLMLGTPSKIILPASVPRFARYAGSLKWIHITVFQGDCLTEVQHYQHNEISDRCFFFPVPVIRLIARVQTSQYTKRFGS